MKSETIGEMPVEKPRLVRPFEVGESVNYRNHVAGYEIFPLTVTNITETVITAKSEKGGTFTFDPATGVADWSPNLSISHWQNVKGHPARDEKTPTNQTDE